MTYISLYWGFCKGSNISYTFVFYTECWKNFGWGLAKDIFPIFLKNAVCLFRFSNYYSHRFFPRPNLDKKNVTAQFKTITFSSSLEITWILHLHYMIILHIRQPSSERIWKTLPLSKWSKYFFLSSLIKVIKNFLSKVSRKEEKKTTYLVKIVPYTSDHLKNWNKEFIFFSECILWIILLEDTDCLRGPEKKISRGALLSKILTILGCQGAPFSAPLDCLMSE